VLDVADLAVMVATAAVPMPTVRLAASAEDGSAFSEKPRQFVVVRCPNCGASPDFFDEDGDCRKCGAPAVRSLRDSFYIQAGPRLAAVSDLGSTHTRNEDDVLIGCAEVSGLLYVWMVLCDGTSRCRNPAGASRAACVAASSVLRAAAAQGLPGDETLLRKAIEAAMVAVDAVPDEPEADPALGPPATTIVAAYIEGGMAHVAGLGDSRGYVIECANGQYRARALTTDNSYLFDLVRESGLEPNQVLKELEAMEVLAHQAEVGIVSVDEALAELANFQSIAADYAYQIDLIAQGETTKTQAIHYLTSAGAHSLSACICAGRRFEPSYVKAPLESAVAMFLTSDGPWNDLDPLNGRGPAKFAEIYATSEGDPLRFARNVAAAASGADNDSVAVYALNPSK
jgi:serine/threonine protein phosphatase PrpC